MIAALLLASSCCSVLVTAVLWGMGIPGELCIPLIIVGMFVFWTYFAKRMKQRGQL